MKTAGTDHITAAEVANAKVQLVGYSLEAVGVINIAAKLAAKDDPNGQYKIDVPIPVDKLISNRPGEKSSTGPQSALG